jgi:hypothetical protein
VITPLIYGCIKASFLFFYLRIFSTNRKSRTHTLLVGLIIMIAIWTLGFFFAMVFQCRLDFGAITGTLVDVMTRCVDTLKLSYSFAISDFITDIIVIVIPIPLVSQ